MLRYKIANSNGEGDSARRLIHHVFVEELGYPGVVPDRFDTIATFLVAEDDEGIVAAVRLIPDGPDGLPVEEYCELSPLRGNAVRLAELSRFACLGSHRGMFRPFSNARFIEECGRGLGVTHFVIDALLQLIPLYRRMGFEAFGVPFFDPTVVRVGEAESEPNSTAMIASLEALIGRCE